MFLLDRLDAVEELDEGVLQCLGVSRLPGRSARLILDIHPLHSRAVCVWVCLPAGLDSLLQLFPRLLAEGLDVFARPPRAHSPHVIRPDGQINRPHG